METIKTPINNQQKRVCMECNKEFSSGKALGGHMRVHLLPHQSRSNKNPNSFKPANPTNFKKTLHQDLNNGGYKPYYMTCVNHEGKPTCSQCGKTFIAMKSLFGHMRCHPERLWRGILPPPTEPVVDLTKFLRPWPVTERRGRKSLKPADVNDNNDVVLLEAVEDLLSLANASDSVTESVKVEEIDSQHKIKRKKKKMKLMMDLDHNAVTVPLAQVTEQLTVTDDECKYKCATCNKGFATHQALGGHRSSHSHNKYRLTSTDNNNNNIHEQHEEIEFVVTHQCKICDKVFATGQALGGHKRCHWGGVTISEGAQALSSQITSTGSGRKVLDFDLNEMPPMEEDASVDGNGYASSSYNSNMG